jgi:hypothetical protein
MPCSSASSISMINRHEQACQYFIDIRRAVECREIINQWIRFAFIIWFLLPSEASIVTIIAHPVDWWTLLDISSSNPRQDDGRCRAKESTEKKTHLTKHIAGTMNRIDRSVIISIHAWQDSNPQEEMKNESFLYLKKSTDRFIGTDCVKDLIDENNNVSKSAFNCSRKMSIGMDFLFRILSRMSSIVSSVSEEKGLK